MKESSVNVAPVNAAGDDEPDFDDLIPNFDELDLPEEFLNKFN